MDSADNYVDFFETIWKQNKAWGLAAQVQFENEIADGIFREHSRKLFHGCWLVSPKTIGFHKIRFCVFVHDKLINSPDEIDPKLLLGEKDRPFYAIAEYMKNAGVGIIYAVPSAVTPEFSFEAFARKDFSSVIWNLFFYEKEKLAKKPDSSLFQYWEGNRGRATFTKKKWENIITRNMLKKMKVDKLRSMLLNELFITGYLRSTMKKPIADLYDVDGFLISLSQKHILPIELKEKFPVLKDRERYFGIDAGRVLMLLRICIPNDSNALYVIRQVSQAGRKLEAWKFMTLSKIIMTSGWNLQEGGIGMGGQSTHTIKLPYDEFEEITAGTFEEDNLQRISDLPKDVKDIATGYKQAVEKRFFAEQQ
jgi:hypothetical protein